MCGATCIGPGMSMDGCVCVCWRSVSGAGTASESPKFHSETSSDHMVLLWLTGPDQSMNSGSGRVSGFSDLFAKWDVSTAPGWGVQAGEGGNDFMTIGC